MFGTRLSTPDYPSYIFSISFVFLNSLLFRVISTVQWSGATSICDGIIANFLSKCKRRSDQKTRSSLLMPTIMALIFFDWNKEGAVFNQACHLQCINGGSNSQANMLREAPVFWFNLILWFIYLVYFIQSSLSPAMVAAVNMLREAPVFWLQAAAACSTDRPLLPFYQLPLSQSLVCTCWKSWGPADPNF